jgi:hypothetical protein
VSERPRRGDDSRNLIVIGLVSPDDRPSGRFRAVVEGEYVATSHRKKPVRQGRTALRAAVAVSGIAAAVGAAPSAIGAPASTPVTTPLDLIRNLLPTGNTVITPDNAADHGFGEPDTRAPGDVDFTNEYGAPKGGHKGALELTTPDSGSKAQYFTDAKNGPLATFATSAAYSTYRSSTSTGDEIQYPSYQIAIDKNGGALESGDFSTLYYEPYYNVDDPPSDLENDTWQRWDVTAGKLCSTRQVGGFESNQTQCDNGGLKSLADIVAANPGATVLGFGLNQGSGNPGITAAADLLTGAGTTYDFEVTKPRFPLPLPPTKDCGDEHHGTWGHDDHGGKWDKDDHGGKWDKDDHGTWDKDDHGRWGDVQWGRGNRIGHGILGGGPKHRC